MKLVRMNGAEIGLLVELPSGPHVVDLSKSLGVFAALDPVSGALINGTMKERCVWTSLVNNWRYLRAPLGLLARTATAHPDDSRLALYPLAGARLVKEPPHGIVALEITDATDLEVHDPTGRLVMARQFGERAAEQVEQDTSATAENVHVIDFPRNAHRRTRRE